MLDDNDAGSSGLPKGWSRMQIQAPTHLLKAFRAICKAEGHGGVKLVSTAMVAMILGLDEEERAVVLRVINSRSTPKDVTSITPKLVNDVLKHGWIEGAPGNPSTTRHKGKK